MNQANVVDQILDLLLDALKDRERSRSADEGDVFFQPEAVEPIQALPVQDEAAVALPEVEVDGIDEFEPAEFAPDSDPPLSSSSSSSSVMPEMIEELQLPAVADATAVVPTEEVEIEPEPEIERGPPPKEPSIGLARLLGQSVAFIFTLLLVINIPFNQHGTTLARAMPDQSALVIRDGLLMKVGDDVYVLWNLKTRWITSIEAFEYYGFNWENVQDVDREFYEQFEQGPPLYLMARCRNSPHIYAIQDGEKKWIKDIETFESLEVYWDRISVKTCAYLRTLPDGEPIPADAGEPPQP